MIKRRRDDKDDDEEPSARSNSGSKRRRARKEHESSSAQKEKTSKSTASLKNGQTSSKVYWNLKIDTLTLELLADLTFELMKVSCKSLVELKYFLEEVYKATTDQIDWNDPKTGNIHMEALTIDTQFTRDDVKLYTFKEGNYKRLHLQDIKDMLRLLVQRNMTNLTIKERLALNVSWRMFTRSIVIQRHVEHLQLGVESYQNKLNLIRPDTYRSDLKRLPPYSAYPNPRGFIYQNKDKKNKLLRIDELHKFIDDTL
nr:hypothetical protein [Tanacetum cinerariifolium]